VTLCAALRRDTPQEIRVSRVADCRNPFDDSVADGRADTLANDFFIAA